MQTQPQGEPKRPKRKSTSKPKDKEKQTNGQANGVAEAKEPFPSPANEAEAEAPAGYEPPDPSKQELKLADEVFRDLMDKAEQFGIQKVVDALIGIVDVHAELRTPEIFGSSKKDDDPYEVAANIGQIARFLTRASSKLEINANKVVFYYRNHEKWTKGGRKVHSSGKKLDGLTSYHLKGMLAFIEINYHLWKTFNPRQKVYTVYHALRERDEDGSKVAPDFQGYFEEPGIFGPGVHEETCRIARAFVRDAAERKGDPHQLPLMAGIFDD